METSFTDIMPYIVLHVFGVVMLTVGLAWLARRLVNNSTRARRARSAPVRTIAELTDGTCVRVVGRVRSVGPPLIAPVTGRECVAFIVTVRRGKYANVLDKVVHEFSIADDTGEARVNDVLADFYLVRDRYLFRGRLRDLPVRAESFVRDHGIDFKHLQLCEDILEEGATGAVHGTANLEAGSEVVTIDEGDEANIAISDSEEFRRPSGYW